MFKKFVQSLLCVSIFLCALQATLADDFYNCQCVFKLDKANLDMYFVLKKTTTDDKCIVMVLSKTSEASPYLEKLKSEENYSVIGKCKTFAGAEFMAIGECPNCDSSNKNQD